jgi:hypothetical protein
MLNALFNHKGDFFMTLSARVKENVLQQNDVFTKDFNGFKKGYNIDLLGDPNYYDKVVYMIRENNKLIKAQAKEIAKLEAK